MADVDPQMLKGLLALLLLALVDEREDYGYSLVDRLRAGGLDDVAEGTVYPALARLERDGFVATRLVPSDRGPARKYYRVNDAGLAELRVGLDAFRQLARIVEHLTKGMQP